MKKATVFAAVSVIVLTLGVFGAYAGEELPEGQANVVIPVTGMTCGACCVKIETAVKGLDGVVAASADYENGNATVTFGEEKVSVETIISTINEKTSFKAEMPEEKG